MGRMKYTEEERSRIMISFIQATRKIIDTEGIDQVSIRKIANQTGMNSATMYLYFSNADVLITMASMGYLEKYCRCLRISGHLLPRLLRAALRPPHRDHR